MQIRYRRLHLFSASVIIRVPSTYYSNASFGRVSGYITARHALVDLHSTPPTQRAYGSPPLQSFLDLIRSYACYQDLELPYPHRHDIYSRGRNHSRCRAFNKPFPLWIPLISLLFCVFQQGAVADEKEVKEITRNYLKRSLLTRDDTRLAEAYQSREKVYQEILDTVSGFIKAAGDDPKLAERLSAFGADSAGIIYAHTSPEHQRYIALYTACMGYADDLGSRNVEALAQFSRRFTTGEKQLSPPLDFLADLLRQSYGLWPEVGADTIISSFMIALTAMHVECTTANIAVIPKATWWPNYFRSRTGFPLPYAHFSFMKGWRPTTDSYMQLLP